MHGHHGGRELRENRVEIKSVGSPRGMGSGSPSHSPSKAHSGAYDLRTLRVLHNTAFRLVSLLHSVGDSSVIVVTNDEQVRTMPILNK